MVVSNGRSSGFPNASDISDKCGVTLSFAEVKAIPAPDCLLLKNTPRNRPIVIVDDGTDVAVELIKKLNDRAVALTFNSRRNKICDRSITLRGNDENSLTAALKDIENKYGTVGGFIYMDSSNTQPGWSLLAAKHVKNSLHQNINNGRCFFLGITRMDGQLGFTGKTITPSPTLSESVLNTAERGSIFGLVKTLGLEWPDVYCRAVDLALNIRSDSDAATYLYNEIYDSDRCLREVGYDDRGQRWTTCPSGLRSEKGVRGTLEAEYRTDDVFLVAGGGRGITPVCMAAVARRVGGGTFFLLGRSKVTEEPLWANGLKDKELQKAALNELKRIYKQNNDQKKFKPTPKLHKALLKSVEGSRAVNESINKINQAGGTAYYLTCDACNENQVASAIRTIKDEYNLDVTGIVQAAGVLRDKMVQNKKFEDFQLVYNTKIVGLRNLLNHVNRQKLRHLVVFSSLAGFWGNKGQSDYAMANDVLNKAAHVLSTIIPTCRVRALDFGPWDGGMVNAQLKAMFKSQGVEIIPYTEGAQIVAAMLTDSKCIQGLVGNWG
jgi:NADP-dependent 3-hydroxy acid dehydrogenase YdfG